MLTMGEFVPTKNDSEPIMGLYEEAEAFRVGLRGFSKYRRALVFQELDPQADAAVQFWFRSHTSMQAVYLIGDNAIQGRCTLFVDYMALVKGTAPTKRSIIKDAQSRGYLIIEMVDRKRKMIRPTRSMLDTYERICIETLRAVKNAIGNTYEIDTLLSNYDEYRQQLKSSSDPKNVTSRVNKTQ